MRAKFGVGVVAGVVAGLIFGLVLCELRAARPLEPGMQQRPLAGLPSARSVSSDKSAWFEPNMPAADALNRTRCFGFRQLRPRDLQASRLRRPRVLDAWIVRRRSLESGSRDPLQARARIPPLQRVASRAARINDSERKPPVATKSADTWDK